MIMYMAIPPGYNLLGLNIVLIYTNLFLPPIAWVIYLFFVYFLIGCVIVGNVRVFSYIPILKNIFPLVYKGTMLNSFMINACIMLVTSLAIIQFTTTAFTAYVNGSAIYGKF